MVFTSPPCNAPLKPGKVRIVFGFAAEYHGISLNQQLLQVPDFINPLVGVLTRFRQEQQPSQLIQKKCSITFMLNQRTLMCFNVFGGQTVNSVSSHKNTEW